MSESGNPPGESQRFNYDDAWAIRLDFIRRKLAQGTFNARQLLAALKRQDRHFLLGTRANGPPAWLRQTFPADTPLWPSGQAQQRMTSIKGEFLTVPSYAEFRTAELLGDLALHYGPFDVIAELGCGSGRNLFELYDELADPRVRYVGGEFAASGIELAREIASRHEARDRFTFEAFDHTRPDLSLIGPAGKALLLTVHSIEQVHRLPLDYFHRLAAAAPAVIGIHIEPFGFQVDAALGPATRHHVNHFARRRWNSNLHHVLRRAEADGVIAVDHVELECFLPIDATNPSSLAIWHRI